MRPVEHMVLYGSDGLLAGGNKRNVVVGEFRVVGVGHLHADTVKLGDLLLEATNAEVSTHGQFATLLSFGSERSQRCILIGRRFAVGRSVYAQRCTECLFEVCLEGLDLQTAVYIKFCHNCKNLVVDN